MAASTPVPPELVTADELYRLPDDGYRYELVAGKLRQKALAGGDHGFIVGDIATLLNQQVKARQLGRVAAAGTGFKLRENPDTVRAPDVAFISHERLAQMGSSRGFLTSAPNLVAEVISPSDTYTEVQDKVQDWLEADTRVVLVVDPDTRTVAVHQADHSAHTFHLGEMIDVSDAVPRWTLPVTEVFASLE